MAGRQANRTLSRGNIATFGMASVILALSLSCAPGAAREDNPQFPAFVYRSEASLQAYQFATAMPELLAQVPCFCGCGQDPAYTSLRDCFIRPEGGFDSHGSNCQTCIDEAKDIAQWQKEGKRPLEIREAIEAKYSRLGPGTKTPLITD